jgi:hypothetical protein
MASQIIPDSGKKDGDESYENGGVVEIWLGHHLARRPALTPRRQLAPWQR